ncbi:MAG: TatD family deoxyribonuclease [Lentisphaerae bacterium]|nr:MAG: TatD family deoxyribonuclease [Lentisphaerota bacterium]
MSPVLFDTHCHSAPSADFAAIYQRAIEAGVKYMLIAGCSHGKEEAMLHDIRPHAGVYAATGIHPHEASAWKGDMESYRRRLDDPQVVAIGEVGLDYYYDHSPREIQRTVFTAFAQLALETGFPLIVHVRNADDDAYAILSDFEREYRRRHPGSNLLPVVIHCFSSGPAWAERYLELGLNLSFTGIITFRRAEDVRASLRLTPHDRFFLETDAPYLAPVPHRGKTNEPALLPHIAEAAARILDLSVEEVAALTTRNALNFWRLPSSSGE